MTQKARQWSFPDFTARAQEEMRRLGNAMWRLGAGDVATDTTASPTTTSTSWVAIDAAELAITIVPVRGRVFASFTGTFQHGTSGVGTFVGIRKGTSGDPAAENYNAVEAPAAGENFVIHAQALFTGLSPNGETTIEAVWKVGAGTATASGTQRNLIVTHA